MFATCSTTLFLVPRHPDFGKNDGKIGLFWFSKKPSSWENHGKNHQQKTPILPSFSENHGKIRDFFFSSSDCIGKCVKFGEIHRSGKAITRSVSGRNLYTS